jgi:hypothetical protein
MNCALKGLIAARHMLDFESSIPPSLHRLSKYIARETVKVKAEGYNEYITRISYPRIIRELKEAGFKVREIAENCYGVKI